MDDIFNKKGLNLNPEPFTDDEKYILNNTIDIMVHGLKQAKRNNEASGVIATVLTISDMDEKEFLRCTEVNIKLLNEVKGYHQYLYILDKWERRILSHLIFHVKDRTLGSKINISANRLLNRIYEADAFWDKEGISLIKWEAIFKHI